ncbi:hypothetical protein [Domibacillus iocasae]|uniref:Uncharacterized protein n=1 Tax=Domibacillus iocasae TaxID=1714016 RepID=A0A1E7DK15_9BACI|nr:hypothetical protein [Domibacillus iocasae]OES43394.1 hypothetical protein BA724_13280 [Domibacillus iocasae]
MAKHNTFVKYGGIQHDAFYAAGYWCFHRTYSLLSTTPLKKKAAGHGQLIRLPAYAGLILSVALFVIGFSVVRGFEDAVYGLLACTILLFPISLLVTSIQKNR